MLVAALTPYVWDLSKVERILHLDSGPAKQLNRAKIISALKLNFFLSLLFLHSCTPLDCLFFGFGFLVTQGQESRTSIMKLI